MQIGLGRNAYGRGERRFVLFRLQLYHEKTTIEKVQNAYRAGEKQFCWAQYRYYYQKTIVQQVKKAYRLDNTLVFKKHWQESVPRRSTRTPFS